MGDSLPGGILRELPKSAAAVRASDGGFGPRDADTEQDHHAACRAFC
jgi:hypothetical protein